MNFNYAANKFRADNFNLIVKAKTTDFLKFFVITLFAVLLVSGTNAVQAQSSLEFFTGSIGTIPNGPTAASQTARLLLNTNNPTGNTIGATNTTVNVTATVSNQQYTGFGTGTGNPVVLFGGNLQANNPSLIPDETFDFMNVVASPANTMFSNTPTGTTQGMDVTTNRAFALYTSVQQWTTTGPGIPATNARVYMGNLTLTFSSPLTNPHVQITGFGGTVDGTLGITTELNLITSGLTLTRLSGNTDFVVSGLQINNANATGINGLCSGSGNGGCGTVRVNGSNITSVTFQVFIRGDGGRSAWADTDEHSGDKWLMGVSMPEAYGISGNVFNDTTGGGTVNGTGISAPGGTQLYVNLIDPTDNTVIGSVPVAAGGTYTLTGVPGSGVNYRLELSTNQGTALAAAPAVALPAGWFNVAENLGAGPGNDGLTDGRINNANVGSANLGNANFGITNVPTAATASISGRLSFNQTPLANVLVVLHDTSSNTREVVRTDAQGDYEFEQTAGETYIIEPLSSKYRFNPASRVVSLTQNISNADFALAAMKNYRPKNDFDGDGKSDLAVFRAAEGYWYVRHSGTGEMSSFAFTDIPVAADYDGDGVTDYAVFRPSEGNWYIWQSATQNLRVKRFGLGTDRLVPADYDGDGKTDIAVNRDGVWYISQSSDHSIRAVQWGLASDKTAVADYDGDGKTDVAVYRPAQGVWYFIKSATNEAAAFRFGAETDVPVAGDYDGDGFGDFAQFRSGMWYIKNSTTDLQGESFGESSDETIVGDYDGDGRADLTTYNQGKWSIRYSSNAAGSIQFGAATDVLVK